MNRFALATLMIVTVLDSANADKLPPYRHPECAADAQRFCRAVIHDRDAKVACVRAHLAQLSQPCVDSLKSY
jgi:hypothetical protein